jgi:hypothetical protein
MRATPRPRQPGLGDLKLISAIAVRVRHAVNGPKAPSLRKASVGRFRSMPPRRPLVGGVKLVGFE